MLARKKLVPLKQEFSRIRKTGRQFDSPSFGLLVSFGSTGSSQASFIISKKIDKRSVVRHQVKRKLAEAVSPLLSRMAKNVELVFLAKTKAVETAEKDLKIEMETLFKRVKLL